MFWSFQSRCFVVLRTLRRERSVAQSACERMRGVEGEFPGRDVCGVFRVGQGCGETDAESRSTRPYRAHLDFLCQLDSGTQG